MDTVLSVLAPVGVTDERGLLFALAGAMAAAGASAFVALTGFAVAPYGKYADKAAWFYGPPINGKVAWIVQEAPSFFVPAYCWWAASSAGGPTAAQLSSLTPRAVLLGMLLAHYANRTFIFPLQIRGGKPTPLVIMLMAFVFCMWNGYLQGRYHTVYADEMGTDLLSPRFIIGTTLFLAGAAINIQADSILRGLRGPGETGYRIPAGGAFDYVSGANFFGEIVEWTGYAIAAGSWPAAAFAFFTFCNIGPRGAQHHAWYLNKFKGEYPAGRRAVIPFIW